MALMFGDYPYILFQLIVAGAFGWILGFERTKIGKPAGTRTFALICMGCTLLTIIGIRIIGNMGSIDSGARLIANIIIGVGFIGAGVIWKEGGSIKGITTAAIVWVCAAIGITVGLGEYLLALLGFFIALFFVLTKKPHEHMAKHGD